MQFLKAKMEHKCNRAGCNSPIPVGSRMIKETYKHSNGSWGNFFYHGEGDYTCYEQYKNSHLHKMITEAKLAFIQKEETKKEKVKSLNKIGRPFVYSNPMKAKSLKSSIFFHRNRGNLARVAELEQEIQNLRLENQKDWAKPDEETPLFGGKG
jgi:hypothetical protein